MDFQARDRYFESIWRNSDDFIPDPEVWEWTDWAKHFGITLKKVAFGDEGRHQFKPSFFRPLEPKFQEKYPIDKHHQNYDPCHLHIAFPVWEDVLNRTTKLVHERLSRGRPPFLRADPRDQATIRYPTRKDIQEAILTRARSYYRGQLELCKLGRRGGKLLNHAPDATSRCIGSYVTAPRKGLPDFKSTALQASPWVEIYHPLQHSWTAAQILVTNHRIRDLLPHTIISLPVRVQATEMEPGPTAYEVGVILRYLMSRCQQWNPHAPNILVHPVLLIAYVGRNHGRITQAFYDGHGLNLQYSPLMSFEDEEDVAPVDLFFRYMLSNPIPECKIIGCTTSRASSSRRLEDISG